MIKRTITGACILLVLVPLIAINHPIAEIGFLVAGIILAMIGGYEMMNVFYKATPTLKKYRFIVPIMCGIIVFMCYLSTVRGLNLENPDATAFIYHFCGIVVFLSCCIVCIGSTLFVQGSTANDMMSCIMTLLYCGLVMGYTISIRYFTPLNESGLFFAAGRSFGYVYTIAILTDVFAFLIGSKFGKHKLCPDISPKKTVEGAIGGLVFGGVLGTGCLFLYQIIQVDKIGSTQELIFMIVAGLLVSLFLSIAVQAGDLIASKIKRTYDVKDFGWIFPGHGGVLDRFDSLIFAGACYYIIAQLVQVLFIWQ